MVFVCVLLESSALAEAWDSELQLLQRQCPPAFLETHSLAAAEVHDRQQEASEDGAGRWVPKHGANLAGGATLQLCLFWKVLLASCFISSESDDQGRVQASRVTTGQSFLTNCTQPVSCAW